MRTFGLCMEGLEEKFEEVILMVMRYREEVRYLEIGVWLGGTFNTVCDILEATQKPWVAWGIDPDPHVEPRKNVTIIAKSSAEALGAWMIPIDICLIDGCHCYRCARNDFEQVEPWITRGGIVLFHDFAPVAQGSKDQHGDRSMLEVRRAVDDLGLLSNTRHGWKMLDEWVGDESKGGTNMGVFQKL